MKIKKVPMRQCVICRGSKCKSELIRVIKTPENEVCIDTTGRKNGRGAYICYGDECIKKARKTKGLDRSLGVTLPEEVYIELERQMLEIEG